MSTTSAPAAPASTPEAGETAAAAAAAAPDSCKGSKRQLFKHGEEDEQAPTRQSRPKRQKTASSSQQSGPSLGASTQNGDASAASCSVTCSSSKDAQHSISQKGGQLVQEAGSKHQDVEEEQEGELASGSSGFEANAASELQLGNVDIAKAGGQALSDAMLQGLQQALSDRLGQYATPHLESDRAALTNARAAADRYCPLESQLGTSLMVVFALEVVDCCSVVGYAKCQPRSPISSQ